MSDKYLAEAGVQGGKVVGEHIVLGSLVIGIPLLIIGLCGLFGMLFGLFSTDAAGILLILLVTVIGLLLTLGGYFVYRDKHIKK